MIAGAAARMSGFMAHLRRQGFPVGPAETELVLLVIAADEFPMRLPSVSRSRPCWRVITRNGRFDELFDAYWFGRGPRVVAPPRPRPVFGTEVRGPLSGTRCCRAKKPRRQSAGPNIRRGTSMGQHRSADRKPQ
jgi:uncharacterized protein with von Willebrand factor type A (vWA) domain